MNYRMLGYVLGRIFMVEAALLLPPSIVAVIYGEWSCLFAFVVTAVGLAVLGLVLGLRRQLSDLCARGSCDRCTGLGADVRVRCAAVYHQRRYPVFCGCLF